MPEELPPLMPEVQPELTPEAPPAFTPVRVAPSPEVGFRPIEGHSGLKLC
jgi:hypothetical protein